MRIIVYILAALGLLFVMQLLFGLYAMLVYSGKVEAFEKINGFGDHQYFKQFVYISPDNGFRHFSDKEQLAAGNARVSGRFVFNGAPAKGVKLKLHINENISSELITDADGVFNLAIPSGQTWIHLMEIENWNGKPEDGDYMVVSKYDRKLSDVLMHRWNERVEQINIKDGENYNLGEFTITERLSFSNPASTKITVIENPSTQILKWNDHPSAETYVLNIQKVTRSGNGETMTSVFRELTNKSEFKMENLTLLPNENETIFEYSLDLKAYNSEGELASEVGHPRSGFKLSGLEIADPAKLYVDQSSTENFLDRSKATEQIEAIRVLLDENMLSSAEELLAKVKSDNTDWRLDRIKGYLAAKQAKCDEARSHFEQAELKAGFKCVADKYWAQCRG